MIYRKASDYNKTELLYFLKRRAKWFLGDRSPFFAYLKVTNRCNLDCYYCPWHTIANDFSEELSTDAWLNIISSMAELGIKIMVFEGGEPTLRSDLPVLLDKAHSLGCSSILATNAYRRDIWRFKPTTFTISVDGPEGFHDSVRGKDSYKRILQNLKCREPQNKVVTITVVSRKNQDLLDEMCYNLAPHIDAFGFTFLYNYRREIPDALLPSEIARVKSRIIALKKNYKIVNPTKHLKCPPGKWRCYDDITVAVNHKGDLSQSCFVEHIEKRDCKSCELGCYQVLSALHEFNLEAWFNLYRLILHQI